MRCSLEGAVGEGAGKARLSPEWQMEARPHPDRGPPRLKRSKAIASAVSREDRHLNYGQRLDNAGTKKKRSYGLRLLAIARIDVKLFYIALCFGRARRPSTSPQSYRRKIPASLPCTRTCAGA